jgi:hypothetical protein
MESKQAKIFAGRVAIQICICKRGNTPVVKVAWSLLPVTGSTPGPAPKNPLAVHRRSRVTAWLCDTLEPRWVFAVGGLIRPVSDGRTGFEVCRSGPLPRPSIKKIPLGWSYPLRLIFLYRNAAKFHQKKWVRGWGAVRNLTVLCL